MSLVKPDSEVESWLDSSSDSFALLTDRGYRDLVARWRTTFGALIEGPSTYQHSDAIERFTAECLPRDVWVFNGLSVQRTATTSVHNRHPTAYRAARLREIREAVAHPRDLLVVTEHFFATCVCTHEAGALSHPAYVIGERAEVGLQG